MTINKFEYTIGVTKDTLLTVLFCLVAALSFYADFVKGELPSMMSLIWCFGATVAVTYIWLRPRLIVVDMELLDITFLGPLGKRRFSIKDLVSVKSKNGRANIAFIFQSGAIRTSSDIFRINELVRLLMSSNKEIDTQQLHVSQGVLP